MVWNVWPALRRVSACSARAAAFTSRCGTFCILDVLFIVFSLPVIEQATHTRASDGIRHLCERHAVLVRTLRTERREVNTGLQAERRIELLPVHDMLRAVESAVYGHDTGPH